MAKTKIFTVYDSKAEAYLPPFFMRSHGEALRAWEATVNDPNTNFNKFPADFTLFELGEFDDATAELLPLSPKRALSNALEVKRPDNVSQLGAAKAVQ